MDNLGFPSAITLPSDKPPGVQSEGPSSSPMKRRGDYGTSQRVPEGDEIAKVNLVRELGQWSSVALIVGSMIGSGIFISPKGVYLNSGSVGLSLVIWAVGGVLSLIGALAFIELAEHIPKSGGDYVYILRGFAPETKDKSFWKPIPAFLSCWVSTFALSPASKAVVTMTCAKYFSRLFFVGCSIIEQPPQEAAKLFAIFFTGIIAYVSAISVRKMTQIQNTFTVAKLIAVALIIVGGTLQLFKGRTETLAEGFQGIILTPSNTAAAFFSSLYAYSGCGQDLLASETVAVTFSSRLIGDVGEVLMVAAVVMSTFGTMIMGSFSQSRIAFAAAREGHLMEFLSYIHIERRTPMTAIFFQAFICCLMISFADIFALINFLGFVSWLFYGASMISLMIFKKRHTHKKISFKVPVIVPMLTILISMSLVIGPIVDSPKVEYFYAIAYILTGVVVYIPFVYYKLRVPGLGKA